MNKFHSIPTDKYIPLSFDNAYLFDQYERINNFLTFNIDKKFKNLLSKPVKSNFDIEWYSIYKDLQQLEGSPEREFGLRQYWLLYEELQVLLKDISRTNDENVRNWVDIIKATFDPENNLIFTNGKDITIIWGWKFENNRNKKPYLLADSVHNIATNIEQDSVSQFSPPIVPESSTEPEPHEDEESIEEINYGELEATIYQADDPDVIKKPSFIAFLKYFAAKYSWILIVLLILICVVFFLKSLKYS